MLKVFFYNESDGSYNSFTGKDAEESLYSHKFVATNPGGFEFKCNCGISISKISSTRFLMKGSGNWCTMCPYSENDHTVMDIIC